MSAKMVDLEDAGGCKISNVAEIDGMLVPVWHGSLEKTSECLSAIPDMSLRDDDVMLSTYSKAGTHWGFEILSMLLRGSTERRLNQKLESWLEFASPADLAKVQSPRVLNSHLPLDRLPRQLKEKKHKVVVMMRNPKDVAVTLYHHIRLPRQLKEKKHKVVVMMRNPKDVAVSLYHHIRLPRQLKEKKHKVVVVMRNPKDVAVSLYHHIRSERMFKYDGEFKDFLATFMEGNIPFGSWFDYTTSVEKALNNNELNIHVTYFEDLKQNGVAEIQKIANFLELGADEKLCQDVNDACAFSKMAVDKAIPKELAEAVFRDGFAIFRKGIIGDWKNYFTVAQNEAFDTLFAEKMAASKFKFKFEASQKQ